MISPSDSSVTQSLKPKNVDEVSRGSVAPAPPPLPRGAAFSRGETDDSNVPAPLLPPLPPPVPTPPPVSDAEPAVLGERPPGGVRVDDVDGPGDCMRPR